MRVALLGLPLLLSACALVDGPVRQVRDALGMYDLSCGPIVDGDRCTELGHEAADQFRREVPGGVPVESVELSEGGGIIVAWVCGSRSVGRYTCVGFQVE